MPAGGVGGINSLGFVGGAGSASSGSSAGGGGGGGASVLKLNGANIAVAAGGGGGAGSGATTDATRAVGSAIAAYPTSTTALATILNSGLAGNPGINNGWYVMSPALTNPLWIPTPYYNKTVIVTRGAVDVGNSASSGITTITTEKTKVVRGSLSYTGLLSVLMVDHTWSNVTLSAYNYSITANVVAGTAGQTSVEGGNGGGGGGNIAGLGGYTSIDTSGTSGNSGSDLIPAGWISNIANNGGDYHTAGDQGIVIIAYYQP